MNKLLHQSHNIHNENKQAKTKANNENNKKKLIPSMGTRQIIVHTLRSLYLNNEPYNYT